METQTKTVYSNLTAGTGSATIWLGRGEWIIENLSALMGAQGAALNGRELGVGKLVLEIRHGDVVLEKHNLAEGFCTMTKPLVMTRPIQVRGPAYVKSYLQHGGPSTYTHSIQMIYRRKRDEY